MGGLTFGLFFSNEASQKVATLTSIELPMVVATAIVVVLSIGTCLIPDIDHPKSSISRKHPIISKLVRLFVAHRELTLHYCIYFLVVYF